MDTINRDYWGPEDKAKSIEATGARPGDRVKCVGETPTGAGSGDFMPGQTYAVIDFCGAPCAMPHATRPNQQPLPRRGYGFLWKRVSE